MDIRKLIQTADAYGKQSVAETRVDEVSLVDILKNIFPGMSKEQEDAVDNVETEINPNETDLENAEEKIDPGLAAAVAAQQQGGGEGGAPTTGATASGDQGDGTRGTTLPGTSTTTQGNTVGQTDPDAEAPTLTAPDAGVGTQAGDFAAAGQAQVGQAGPDEPTVGNMPAAQNPSGQNDAEEPATSQDSQKDLMTRYNEGGKQAMPEIEKLQQDLKDLGFDPNGVDGKYGNGTFKAVQEFQRANGLQVDGQAGPQTLAKIEELKAGGGDNTSGSPTPTDVQDRTRGSDTAQANPAQTNAPDAETQEIIDQLNDLINQMMPAPTLSASADQDSITAMRGAIKLAESFLREATQEQIDKLSDLLTKLGDSDWAKNNNDAYQAFVNRANVAMSTRSVDATPNATTAAAAGRADAADAGGATDAEKAAGAGVDGPADATAAAAQGGDASTPNASTAAAAGRADAADAGGATDAEKAAGAGQAQPAAPKVSKEVYIQMAPDRPASQTNFNVAKMKAKYPKPYVEIPNTDGTVTRGYGPEKNLKDFIANKGKKLNAKIVSGATPAAPPKNQGSDRAPTQKPSTQTQQRGTLAASKEYTMKNKVNESASMNISADNASEIAELLGILKNAGMPDAAPVADMHVPEPQGPMPCATCGGDHDADSPCGGGEEWDNSPDEGYGDMMDIIKLSGGPNSNKNPGDIRIKDPSPYEDVEEDGWDNSPDEEYKDDDYMYQSGGIHKKKKSHPPVAGGDNPMALENSIKAQLYKALEEKLQNK